MTMGIDLIAAERQRQISEEGWTAEHDKGHVAQLAMAAACYALAGADDADGLRYTQKNATEPPDPWPWELREWKPTGDAVRDLVKAGALIAAAIDSELAERSESVEMG